MPNAHWRVVNPGAPRRVIVTKELPGRRWTEILAAAGCRIEICTDTAVLPVEAIVEAIGQRCDGAIGQLTEPWGETLFSALAAAGGRAYSNYAVGFNNIDLAAATAHGIPVGNTPGVLTETTAEMAVALTFAAARRTGEAERFLRAGRYHGWLPDLFLGELLWRKTVGIVGAGRIGAAYARMMMEGHKTDILYYDLHPNAELEAFAAAYAQFLETRGEPPVVCRRAGTVAELLAASDVVSLHTLLDESTRHLIDRERLALMKKKRHPDQHQPGAGGRRGRPGGPLPAPSGLSRRSGCLRKRARPGRRSGRAGKRGDRAPHRLDHPLDPRGDGGPGGGQRSRLADRPPGVEPAGHRPLPRRRSARGRAERAQRRSAGARSVRRTKAAITAPGALTSADTDRHPRGRSVRPPAATVAGGSSWRDPGGGGGCGA